MSTLLTLLLFSSLSITPCIIQAAPLGHTLYAGGIGPGNYTTIQDAINAATAGDTVYVYDDHAPYTEHLCITTPLTLQGENPATTIVDGNNTASVITVLADHCTITGLLVQHSGHHSMIDANIYLQTHNSTVHDTIIRDSGQFACGIFYNNSQDSTVYNNTIYGNGNEGVYLRNTTRILITDNTITDNRHCSVVISMASHNRVTRNFFSHNQAAGVSIWPNATYNMVDNNTITNCPYSGIGLWAHATNNTIRDNHLINETGYGIVLTHADDNLITHNEINGSSNPGIILHYSNRTMITANDFIDNIKDASFENSSRNHWKANYYSDHPFGLPVFIIGTSMFPKWKPTPVHWINVDWQPATTPYSS